jgi:hypothetical protein
LIGLCAADTEKDSAAEIATPRVVLFSMMFPIFAHRKDLSK